MISPLQKRLAGPGFKARVGDNSTLMLAGGRSEIGKDEIIASINSSSFRDKAWWNLFLKGSTPVDRPKNQNGIIEFISDRKKHRMFIHETGDNAGKGEWEIGLEEAPEGNRLVFDLVHSGLAIAVQKLTQADIESGNGYAYPAAEGSLAIYSPFRDNEYKAGKVANLDRMWCRGRNGKFYWLDMEIEAISSYKAKLTVILPYDLLYPAIVGPTIGYDNVGVLLGALGGFVSYYGPETPALENGTIDSIHIAIAGAVNPEGVKVSISNCPQNAPYDPEGYNLIAQASDTIIVPSDDFVVGNLVNYENVIAGNYYMYGLTFQFNNTTRIKYDSFGSQPNYIYPRNYPIEMQNAVPVTSTVAGNAHITLYAKYTKVNDLSNTIFIKSHSIKREFVKLSSGFKKPVGVKGVF